MTGLIAPQPSLCTLAYPSLSADADAWIDGLRARQDADAHRRLPHHFTLLFPCDSVPLSAYLRHVEDVADSKAPISFHCRYAMLSTDVGPQAFVFLVPDEGYSGLSLLHDALYSEELAPWQRLDLPFVPHMTIGRHADRSIAKQWCDALNRHGVDVPGRIDRLSVVAVHADSVELLADLPLAGGEPLSSPA